MGQNRASLKLCKSHVPFTSPCLPCVHARRWVAKGAELPTEAPSEVAKRRRSTKDTEHDKYLKQLFKRANELPRPGKRQCSVRDGRSAFETS